MFKATRRVLSSLAVFLVLACSEAGIARAQDTVAPWENFDFTKQVVKPADLAKVAGYDLKYLRGIVFGRHGRIFKDSDIKSYLENQSWYKANPDFSNGQLNDIERANLDVIRDAEART